MKKRILNLILVSLLIIVIIVFCMIYNIRYYDASDFGITVYESKIDYDNDGIEDQKDILENVKRYIATKPKYKSKYYKGGYSDDEYGVCTDVVAFGLKGAGYDLRELVNEDIISNREKYNIDIIDKDIDFRRVVNLLVYFKNNAISLTIDVKDISQWQPGDIVVFKGHVGVISDRRNKRGVPYVIHHQSVMQFSYEEDILEKRNDIIGHFRIS